MRTIITALLLLASLSLTAQTPRPASTDNVDSCDISVMPAATLLLPYFEVDTTAAAGAGTTTLFTVTNTSRYPQIAHVTVWTEWGFPVLAFNLFLSGYDVQGINLYDVIVRGIVVAGAGGTSINSPPGSPSPLEPSVNTNDRPSSNTANPNFVTSGAMNVSTTCANLPGTLPADLAAAVKSALTSGTGYEAGGVNCSGPVGFNHGFLAKGYATIDVVSYCTTQLPSEAGGSYFTGPASAILFDNVLTGDYQQIGPSPAGSGVSATFDADGGPMVHIRAVPEGGLSGAGGGIPLPTNLPFTFYDRYTPAGYRAVDRRQPLPSVWSARFVQGGTNGFATDLKIWREGITAGQPRCNPESDLAFNSQIAIRDIVRFDEHENAMGLGVQACPTLCSFSAPALPAASRTGTSAVLFPNMIGTDVGGWFYLDLSSGARYVSAAGYVCEETLSAQRRGFGSCNNSIAAVGFGGSRATTQNWVISSLFGAFGSNRLAVDFDATALGNGCTPAASPGAVVGPAWQPGGQLICPNDAPLTACGFGTVRPPVNP